MHTAPSAAQAAQYISEFYQVAIVGQPPNVPGREQSVIAHTANLDGE